MSAAKKPKKGACRSCGKTWTDHYGSEVTCRKLTTARSALMIIQTWAEFRTGIALNPTDTAKLCAEALNASAP